MSLVHWQDPPDDGFGSMPFSNESRGGYSDPERLCAAFGCLRSLRARWHVMGLAGCGVAWLTCIEAVGIARGWRPVEHLDTHEATRLLHRIGCGRRGVGVGGRRTRNHVPRHIGVEVCLAVGLAGNEDLAVRVVAFGTGDREVVGFLL
jgi:hypothetical protein